MLILAFALAFHFALPLPDQAALDAFLTKELKRSGAPGMTVGIVEFGKLAYVHGFGLADVQKNLPADDETVYRVGSITKQFTSMMVMQLVQEGKLRLDEKASDILTDMPAAWSAVTVRQLLNHTAGVPSYTDGPNLGAMISQPTSSRKILDSVRDKPLDFEPGTKWVYSNSNYILLGLVIEKIEGVPYGEVIERRILKPLGMANTYFVTGPETFLHRANGYTHNSGKLGTASFIDMSWPFAAGSLETTVGDMAKWDAALYTTRLLSRELLDEMWTPTNLKGGSIQPYGFGWALGEQGGTKIIDHNGGINGFNAAIRRAPSKGETVIVLMNTDDAEAMATAKGLLEFIDPALADRTPALEDQDKATTDLIRRAVESVFAGQPLRELFSKEMNDVLSDQVVSGMAAQSASLGALQGMDLMKANDKDGIKYRIYRLRFEKATLKGTFQVDAQGLIQGANLQPE